MSSNYLSYIVGIGGRLTGDLPQENYFESV